MPIGPGTASPLGATFDGRGVNFAIAAEDATAVHLCLFGDAHAGREHVAIPLTARTGAVWHAYLPGIAPGQLYGYRAFGPWDPARGLRFNPAKILLDPYAKAIGRPARVTRALCGHAPGTDGTGAADDTDSAPFAVLAAVVDPNVPFDWRGDAPPDVPWDRTVIYEAHVKGLTALHPDVAPALRGTYRGLASPPVIAHLHRLGVTTVELMPVHAHVDELALVERGLLNYWGYNSIGYFAPDPRFASSRDAIHEFREMVRALHAAGLEVILDVVYNHTAESDHLGPTLSWRGLDNVRAYRLASGHTGRYDDFTGCGNTVDLRSPAMLQLVIDSLRYWVEAMHVDGFRFDLATALLRETPDVDWRSPFLAAIAADPVLSRAKLIAEPWDTAPGGYQLGGFPPDWSEWNDRYRDAARRFWRGDAGALPELATRLAGSRDVFSDAARTPRASVNFVTAHDGFTLADLVAYSEKHNHANGEENRDGRDDNFSWNCGAEGPTDDPDVIEIRARQRRNLFLTLAVSQGVPMISGGDELGRTQHGNNNAYCHDTTLTWTPWTDAADRSFLEFASRAFALRAAHPVLRRRSFLDGRQGERFDVLWLTPEGGEMAGADWSNPNRRAMGMWLQDDEAGDSLLVLFNAAPESQSFVLPDGSAWRVVLETGNAEFPAVVALGRGTCQASAYSTIVLEPQPPQAVESRRTNPEESSNAQKTPVRLRRRHAGGRLQLTP